MVVIVTWACWVGNGANGHTGPPLPGCSLNCWLPEVGAVIRCPVNPGLCAVITTSVPGSSLKCAFPLLSVVRRPYLAGSVAVPAQTVAPPTGATPAGTFWVTYTSRP